MNKIVKNTLILTAITLISGIALGGVFAITEQPIAKAQEAAKKEAWQQVFPEASMDDFKEESVNSKVADTVIKDLNIKGTVDEVCSVKGGEDGYVITATDKEGYGGDIRVAVGITSEGAISGISILSISETAGLGMKATEPAFYGQYEGKQTEKFSVSKDGGDGEPIDALSGATITSRAVTGAVNAALAYYQNAF